MGEEHEFGGAWTEDKLQRLEKYLRAYMSIFSRNEKAKLLKPVYVDALAGSGAIKKQMAPHGGLMQDDEPLAIDAFMEGSARIALNIEPPFAEYLFIDKNDQHTQRLERLRQTLQPDRAARVTIVTADANGYLQRWCKETDWKGRRAVVFLDPYGTQVDWSTVQAIARTEAIDLWYLWPYMAVNRMLPRNEPPPPEWKQTLTRLLGSEEWEKEFYPIESEPTLFGETSRQPKRADEKGIVGFLVKRLQTEFHGVAANPLILRNTRKSPQFVLCFAASNRKGAKTAVKIAQQILR